MTKKYSNRKYRFIIPAILIVIFFSCTDKKEYNMELAFQRQMTAQAIRENDRLLKRIEKEIADEGNRDAEVLIQRHARHIISVRNKYIDSVKSVTVLIENIKPVLQQAGEKDSNALTLLHYYQEELKQKSDSLLFQKFINVYLTFEKNALDEIMSQVSGSCSWGLDWAPHVITARDTIASGQLYELTVVPDMYDNQIAYVHDDCQLTVYKDEVPVELKPVITKRGPVFLISLNPKEVGMYKLKGTFTQGAYGHSYIFPNVFVKNFVVK